MNRRAYLLAACCALAIAGLWWYGRPHQDAASSLPTEQERHWLERINDVGPKNAYIELGERMRESSPEEQHGGAHAFGGALYKAEGADGLAVCDSSFNFGCYHEFLGRAIAAEGLGSMYNLNERCFGTLAESPLSCQHGIGHGVIAYLGYGERSLLDSLKECRDLPHADPIGGCYGGVFMEYNMQTMLATQARLRPLGDNPHEPCDTLEDAYTAACYYWQPQWWAQMLRPGTVGEEAFKKMGGWCAEAGNNAKDCYEGIGNITPPESEFSPARARALCEAVGSDWRGQLYCKSVAANSLSLGGAGMKGDGLAVCEGLKGEAYEYCAAYARNESNILNRGMLSE